MKPVTPNQTAGVLVRADQCQARTTLAWQEGSIRAPMKARRGRRASFIPRLLPLPRHKESSLRGHTPGKGHHKHTPCESLPCDQRGHSSLRPTTHSNKVSPGVSQRKTTI